MSSTFYILIRRFGGVLRFRIVRRHLACRIQNLTDRIDIQDAENRLVHSVESVERLASLVFTAIERILPECPDCQFILFTAYEEFDLARRAIDLGVLAYLTKPVGPKEVAEKVRQAVARREGRQAEMLPDSPVDRIRRYMREHLDASLSQVAEYMQMHPAYLSRYFRDKTGENFVDVHRKMRMERAKEWVF